MINTIRLLLSACLVVLVSAPATAQEVRYVTVSRAELAGPLGAIAGAFGGGESRTTTYHKGSRMRVDSEGTSSIYDFEAGRLVMLRHDTREYTEFTLADMQEMATAMAAQMAAASDQPTDDVQFDVQMRVDRTGERRTIDGSDAERFYIILETSTTYAADGQQPGASGRMVVFVDSWRSTDSPIHRAMQGVQVEDVSELSGAMSGIGAAYAGDPRLAEAMREAAVAAQELEGAPLLETTSVFIIPEGAEFDVAAAASGDDGGPSLGDVAGQAIGGAIGGALGGLFGGRRAPEPEPEPEPAPRQSRLISTTSEVVEIEERVDDAVFQLPEGYTRVEFEEFLNIGEPAGR